MSPLRIGILTFHRCINYGSYWQARCLVDAVRARGHDAVLLDHHSPQVNRAEWKCALRPLLPTATPKADYSLYAQKTRKFFRAIASLPLSNAFALEDPAEMESFDIVVVGSDEVWNFSHPWYAGRPLFFGEGVPAKRLVSYAASFGNYDASNGLARGWAKRLRRFSAISVRDENSRRLIQDSLDHEPDLVLDPCLLYPPAFNGGRTDARSSHVALYGHNFPEWLRRSLRCWANARGYKISSIGYRNDWADEQRISIGPEEFARLMAMSAAVATNFFHGCIFALVNRKPFVCAATDYRFNKISALAASIGAREHLVTRNTNQPSLELLLDKPLKRRTLARIETLRRRSNSYLDNALA